MEEEHHQPILPLSMSNWEKHPINNFVMNWKLKHEAYYWKERCKKLEEQNKQLQQQLNLFNKQSENPMNSDINIVLESSTHNANTEEYHYTTESTTVNYVNDEGNGSNYCVEEYTEVTSHVEDDDIEFEVSEEMLAFLEVSAKHKIELKRQREKENQSSNDTAKCSRKEKREDKKIEFPGEMLEKRRNEMKTIYGDSSPMILSMETALQLTFDRFVGKHKANLWPNIPLNL